VLTTHGVLVLGVGLVVGTRGAAADGERSPMFGVALVGAESALSPDQHADLAGGALELAWWHGRIGLAAEGSARWSIAADDSTRAIVAGASARVLVLQTMMPALLEPRDVEVGVELQGIVERTWWTGAASQAAPLGYGLGLALRLRGTGDKEASVLIAESRFFVRVMSSGWRELDVARTTSAVGGADRALTVLIGIGASFGVGTTAYVDRFRLHPFGPTLL
jgi:hypothetical protein